MVTPHADTPRLAGGVGEAALGMAMARASEWDAGCPLFNDPYAQMFVDAAVARGWELPAGASAGRIRAISGYAASRTRWFDEFFIAAGAHGLDQAVIVAAGLDARAWRQPWVTGSVVFEIDQPEVLDFKAETLRADDIRPAVARYVPVPADLRDDWPEAMRHNGFNRSEPTAWAIEGLVPHLVEGLHLVIDRIHELSSVGSRIAVEAVGSDVAEWLAGRGWEVSTLDAQALMDRYDRCEPDGDPTVPETVFVEGHLVDR